MASSERSRLRFFLVEEVAEKLRVTPDEVLAFVRAGYLSALVIDEDTIRISPGHLQGFIRARTEPWAGWRKEVHERKQQAAAAEPPPPDDDPRFLRDRAGPEDEDSEDPPT